MLSRIKEIAVMIAAVYTIISVCGAIVNQLAGTETNNMNVIVMFILVTLACIVLSMYKFFENLSPLLIIVIQYAITIGLVMLVIWISSFFEEVAEGGYFDMFISFTIPYIILAAFFYVDVFRTTKKENQLLEEIKFSRENIS